VPKPRPNTSLRHFSLSVLAGCVGLLAAPAAMQAQAPVELDWSAPQGCPDREDVLHILRERLTEQRPIAPLRARAKIARHGAGYRLVLELFHHGTHAQRSLNGSQCERLGEAAAVLIVLAVERESVATPSEPDVVQESPAPPAEGLTSPPSRTQGAQEPDVSESSPPVIPPDTAPSAPEEDDTSPVITHDEPGAAAATSGLRLQLWAAARADFGTFPHQPALGAQAQLAARLAPLYMALGATYWPAREQRSVTYPNARLSGSGVFGDLALGWDISAKPVVLTPALNVELGLLYAEALGIAGPERTRTLWFALGPSVSAAVNILSDLWLALEISGLVPAYQTHWLVRTPRGDVPAFDAAPLVLRVAVRVGYAVR